MRRQHGRLLQKIRLPLLDNLSSGRSHITYSQHRHIQETQHAFVAGRGNLERAMAESLAADLQRLSQGLVLPETSEITNGRAERTA